MRDYEVTFIVHPDLDENAFAEILKRVQDWITESDGTVSKTDVWGKRKLAYAIRKKREGQYVHLNAKMAPSFCTTLERNMRLTEPIMRFLVVRLDD
jgi:small subunit ribosomal protein S6